MATIATQNGTDVSREHNKRNPKVVSKEKHIREDGVYEIWYDESPIKAYDRLFGAALEEYNAKQKRSDRIINSYYHHIENDANKHPVYEMIIGVYGDDHTYEQEYEIVKEFYEGWKERNPNLEICGAYWHFDEQGKNGHLHLDYIPVAHNQTRSLRTQNALVKAFNEMGFETKGIHNTAQIQWEARENAELEKICIAHGLTVEHPKKEKQQHLNKEEYIQKQRIEELQKENAQLKGELQRMQQTYTKNKEIIDKQHDHIVKQKESFDKNNEVLKNQQSKIDDRDRTIKQQAITIAEQTETITQYNDAIEQLDADLQQTDTHLTQAAANLTKTLDELKQAQTDRDRTELQAKRAAAAMDIAAEGAIQIKKEGKAFHKEQKSYINPHVQSAITSTQNKLSAELNSPVYIPEDVKDLQRQLNNARNEISRLNKQVETVQNQSQMQIDQEVAQRMYQKERNYKNQINKLEKDLSIAKSDVDYLTSTIEQIGETYNIDIDHYFAHSSNKKRNNPSLDER